MRVYNAMRQLMWRGLCVSGLLALSACATKPQPELGIKWLSTCKDLPVGGLDPEVVARTQCGIVTVPLDHLNPAKGTLNLDITRVAAILPQAREGAIFTNPGGPGSNGNSVFTVWLGSIWKGYGEKPGGDAYRHLIQAYDVIGITPRGQSGEIDSQLVCQSDEVITAHNDVTEDRSTGNLEAIQHNAEVLARGCASQSLAPYINTDQTARDMEFVRAELKESKLNYFGNSYGTWLGAWYAGVFPEQVGRMVLDSSVDWNSTFQSASLSGALEKERIFNHFVAHHAASNPQAYQMGNDPEAIQASFLRLLPEVRAAMRADSDFYSSAPYLLAARVLSTWLSKSPQENDFALEARSQTHLFSSDSEVDQAAKHAFTNLLAATRNPVPWNGITPGPLKLSPADSVRTTVLCNDSPASNHRFWVEKENLYAIQYPVGGSHFHARHCAGWTGPQHSGVPVQNLKKVDSLLMVQAEYDAQTPKAGAFNAFNSLSNAHMILLKETHGHGVSFADLSECVNKPVGEYLAYGRKPERLTVCSASG